MIKNGMYFAKQDIYDLIRSLGGTWNDSKERPLVCIIESKEINGLYYAIPLGNYEHRNPQAKKRIQQYLDLPESKIESCYYHVGNTTVKSIFFISDVIPITDKYIEREYTNYFSNQIHEIKNKKLITELERKVSRILAWEKGKPNYFRQHISDVKDALIKELNKHYHI